MCNVFEINIICMLYRAEHCVGYILRKTDSLPGRPSRRCAECNKTRCLVIRRKRNMDKNECNGKKTRNMRNKVKNWLKKYIRLQRKVHVNKFSIHTGQN